MLEALFGNSTIQKILIFLFVNGKCYGTQLHKFLKTPLTPIQKALQRLERGGIISSYYEGKTRLYTFNPTFLVLNELESLLKKTYTHLPANDKKNYYIPIEHCSPKSPSKEAVIPILLEFWKKLSEVTQLIFHARSKSDTKQNWTRHGSGEVTVHPEGDTLLLFKEKGYWKKEGHENVNFTNVFRWKLDKFAGVISLEHLRRGPEHPVFLFYLAPTSSSSLSSVDSHLCDGDTYFGRVNLEKQSLKVSWRIIGPHKNEELDYYYL